MALHRLALHATVVSTMPNTSAQDDRMQALFEAGAHIGYDRSRKHPSTEPYLYTERDRRDIIDLSRTVEALERAEAYLESHGQQQTRALFVGTKPEARDIVQAQAERIGQPYMINRWIGGTLTNFGEMRKRISRLEQLRSDRESGELERKYTKRERLSIEREIGRLEHRVGGLVGLEHRPAAIVIVDPRHDETAVAEAQRTNTPIVSLAGTDCDIRPIRYPVVANDTLRASVRYIVRAFAAAYERGSGKSATETTATTTKAANA